MILLSIQHLQLLSGLDHQVRTGGEGVNILEPLVCGLSHRAERNCSPKKACVSLGSVEMTGGRSPVIEIHEKVTVVHCHFNFTTFAGPPQKVTVY